MPRAILALASIALSIFALADCIQTTDDRVRGIPRWAWIVLIVIIPWIGPITWLLVGKDRSGPAGAGRPGRPRREGPMAPDDDPEFLRSLDEQIRRERRERERGSGAGDEGDGGSTPSGEDGEPRSAS